MVDMLDKMILRYLPIVHTHLHSCEINLMACFSQYMMSLFIYDTPLELSLRVVDMFLFEGEQVIYRVILKMLNFKRERILTTAPDELCVYLRKSLVKECVEELHITSLLMPYIEEPIEDMDIEEYTLL